MLGRLEEGADFCVPPLRKACTLRTLCAGSEKLVSPQPHLLFLHGAFLVLQSFSLTHALPVQFLTEIKRC